MRTEDVINILKDGNKAYLNGDSVKSKDFKEDRKTTFSNGQHPFCIILTCSDSRVIPEYIFSCKLGSLFVIRNAGNVVGDDVLASIQYGVEHLKISTIIVLGHTNCGAVQAALQVNNESSYLHDEIEIIKENIQDEKDYKKAVIKNASMSVEEIKAVLKDEKVSVIPALYDIDSGKVDFNV